VLNIVLPLAGRGQRFIEAGFEDPKPLVPVHGIPMVEVVLRNVRPRRPHRVILLVLREHLDGTPLAAVLRRVVPDAVIVPVDGVTQGAACTVLLAADLIDAPDPLLIANTDQWVDEDIDTFLAAADAPGLDGLIMTFDASDPKWSYAQVAADGRVERVVEKEVVSREATVGIYHFRRGDRFVAAARRMIAKDLRVNGEFYVAPVYNELIAAGGRVGIRNIGAEHERMHGMGTPDDLRAFLATAASRRATAGTL
jgi:NDP-sugar pyrophosphorylase family protein